VNDLHRYDGKRVLVVGCYSGMGAATAEVLELLGAEVHGVDYKQPDRALAGFTACDLRDRGQIDTMLSSLEGSFDGLFYCAGLPQTHPPLDVMTVNFVAMRHVVEGLRSRINRGGAIAVISSNAGLQFMEHMAVIGELLATPGFEEAQAWCKEHSEAVADGYGFSKEAIIVFTMQRAIDLVADGIRLNCISPGPTATPMMPEFEKAVGDPAFIQAFYGPMGRLAQPSEMAWPLVFLNSDAASFVTGLNMVVDAGFVAGVMTGKIDLAGLVAQGQDALAANQS
jgi:NAD(P)-dependent dehydrogenase (short-subunit alcohol dehydrogenase family)